METSDMFDPSSGKHDNDLDIEVDNSTCTKRKYHNNSNFLGVNFDRLFLCF